ncbi:MAG: bifunctional DNA primase/polymerase [Sandaracinaceae bacterium]|nr:bifunctional DNA primase/polymerase [Sandaracinaceae bacterium]
MSGSVRSHVPLDAALAYAALGYHVFPVFEIGESGQCACGQADCNSPGKHPRTSRGHKDATTRASQIANWWEKYPQANVGIRTGVESGLFVLDVDPRHGGDAALAELEHQHGALPATIDASTGGGGRHLWFAMPGTDARNRTGFRPGLDIRGKGGFAVVPPSNHKSGRRYEWKPWLRARRAHLRPHPCGCSMPSGRSR